MFAEGCVSIGMGACEPTQHVPKQHVPASVCGVQDTKLQPNSFLFISIPAASRAQWHPFTLAYVRNSTTQGLPAKASLHIKPYGKWSQVRPFERTDTQKNS